MKKIGITGGSGLLGKLLIKKLKKKKINYSLFNKDIINKNHIKNWLFRNNDIEYIFHFAAYTSAEKSKINKKKAFNTNVLGTKNLLEVLMYPWIHSKHRIKYQNVHYAEVFV